MSNVKTIIMIIIRALCIILFPLSYLVDELSGELTYFTVQSNIFVLVVMAVFIVFDILKLLGKNIKPPKFMYVIKLVSTTAICITFIIYGVVLTPVLFINNSAYVVFSYSSIVMHQVIPIVAVVDWLLDETDKKFSFGFTPVPMVFGVYYFIFTNIAEKCGATYPQWRDGKVEMENFPYFFLDYYDYGWFDIKFGESILDIKLGVAYWIIIIAVLFAVISILLILFKNLTFKAKLKKQLVNE